MNELQNHTSPSKPIPIVHLKPHRQGKKDMANRSHNAPRLTEYKYIPIPEADPIRTIHQETRNQTSTCKPIKYYQPEKDHSTSRIPTMTRDEYYGELNVTTKV